MILDYPVPNHHPSDDGFKIKNLVILFLSIENVFLTA